MFKNFSQNKYFYVFSATCICLIVIFAYSSSLNGKFVWDDEFLVENNNHIKKWNNIKDVLIKDIGAGGDDGPSTYYRPIQMLTYMFDYSLWKLDVRGYHALSVVFHMLAGMALLWFINALFKNRVLAFLCGILYAAHPIHVESVSYISARADTLSAIFILSGMALYLNFMKSKNIFFYCLMILSYILAVLSKEVSVIFPILIIAYHYAYREKIIIRAFAPIAFITFLYLVMRATILAPVLSPSNLDGSLARIPGFFVAVTEYFRIMILPFGLHMDYGDKIFSPFNFKAIFGCSITAVFLLYAVLSRKQKAVAFFIFWFFINLIPYANIFPAPFFMAEHFLYIASISFFIGLAGIIIKIYETRLFKLAAIGLTSVLCVFYGFSTFFQNFYWKDPITFYERIIKYNPESYKALNNLALAYVKEGRIESAIPLYEQSIELSPNDANGYNNLGILFSEKGDLETAEKFYIKAFEKNSNDVKTIYNLANLYNSKGEKENAITFYKRAIKLNSENGKAYNNLANVYSELGRMNDALESYEAAIKINPTDKFAYNNLATIYRNKKDFLRAIELYQKAITIDPSYPLSYQNLGITYALMGEKKKSVEIFYNLINIAPDDVMPYYHLGMILADLGNKEEALNLCEKAVERNPQNKDAYNNLGLISFKIGNKELAVFSFKKALEFSSRDPRPYFNLAVFYYTEKNFLLAREYCDKAVSLGYNVPPRFLSDLSRSER
ncbi:transmembrane and TPR repeat-containing protein 1 [Candidatus Omnitrophus magneticus]|uniref:Transmembrane and TPR repeat-containing protein 1 n=1 Tax=Candidatus Omnitrophus magneticus TaxID=1609969 RepID=A0A0F0CTS9_9BACT|nr:transmembrane and TPR repeat-containing protein 1 [Candidatus Omnitrophus magneticus]